MVFFLVIYTLYSIVVGSESIAKHYNSINSVFRGRKRDDKQKRIIYIKIEDDRLFDQYMKKKL